MRRESLLALCRSLPLVTEDVKWGADLCFSIGGKMFAVFSLEGGAGFGCKCTEDDFHGVTQLEGIVPSKYLAKHFWISVHDGCELPESEAKALLEKSYELVLDKLSGKLKQSVAEARGAEKAAVKKAAKKPATKKLAAKKPAAKKPAAKKAPVQKAARRRKK